MYCTERDPMEQPPRTVIVPRRVRSHEVGLFIVSVVTSIGVIVAPAPEVTAVFPGWTARVWAVAVLVSGVAGLIGCLWRGRVTVGLAAEGTGLILSGAACVWYMVGAWIINERGLVGAELTVATWGLMNLWRLLQIHLDRQELS